MRHSIRILSAAIAVAAFALVLTAPAAHAEQDHYRGCLYGTHDNYLLRADTGELYRLRDHSEDDIRAHLGEVVDVRGHIKDGEREREARSESVATANAAELPKHAIDVSEIHTAGGSCAKVENGVAVIVPGNTAVVVAPGQTTTANVVATSPALPQSSTTVVEGEPAMQHFTGCMVGTDDFFVLKADDGTLYRLRAESGLREHVGETVDVGGRIDNSKREIEAQQQAGLAQRLGVQLPQVGINVSSIKTLAKGCSTH